MNKRFCRMVYAAGLALLVGSVSAQTTADTQPTPPGQSAQNGAATTSPTERLPASGDRAADTTPQPSTRRTEKMGGQTSAHEQPARKTHARVHHAKKSAHPAAKRSTRSDQLATRGDKSYNEALRQCARDRDPSRRDRCLDHAIERFRGNT